VTRHALRLHRDPHGLPRAEATGNDPALQHWARFFESELTGNEAFCARLLAEGEARAHARHGSWTTTGNAYAIALDATHATLRPLFGQNKEQQYLLPSGEFLTLVRRWRELID
jgi:hypothetical protein